jgi:hypothetical protein
MAPTANPAVEEVVDLDSLGAVASGFYGPGSLAAWYLVVASVIATWCNDKRKSFRTSGDFIAATAYPIVATGHLIVQLVRFPGDDMQYLLDNTCALLGYDAYRPLPKEELLNLVAGTNAALRVADNYWMLCAVGLFGMLCYHHDTKIPMAKTRIVRFVMVGSLAWTTLANLVLMIRGWGIEVFGNLFLAALSHASVPYFLLITILSLLMLGVGPFLAIQRMLDILHEARTINGSWATWAHRRETVRTSWMVLRSTDFLGKPKAIGEYAAMLILACTLVGTPALMMWAISESFDWRVMFPPVGVPLSELDQAAALVGGLLTFGTTLVRIVRSRWLRNGCDSQRARREECLLNLH